MADNPAFLILYRGRGRDSGFGAPYIHIKLFRKLQLRQQTPFKPKASPTDGLPTEEPFPQAPGQSLDEEEQVDIRQAVNIETMTGILVGFKEELDKNTAMAVRLTCEHNWTWDSERERA